MSYLLNPHPKFKKYAGPVVLVIMDGVGIGNQDAADAVFLAKTPTLDRLQTESLYTQLKAHGTAVGMPSDADMGNSEVGHNALGAGRVFDQGASLVANAIQTGELFTGSTWNTLINNVKAKKSTLHLIGLLSDGNVHAHVDHVVAMANQAEKDGIHKLRLHILTDGRDVAERSALKYIEIVENTLNAINAGGKDFRIASGGGRMITTMDRYNADWSIVERGWNTHVLGEARQFASAPEAISTMYQENPKVNDQYLEPFVIAENGQPIGTIQDDDSVIFFNFRGDRAIELTIAFQAENFTHFDRKRVPKVVYAGMMQYDGDLQLPKLFLVNPPAIDGAVSQYLCASGIRAFAISETQKYGHVTYFWNGNKSGYINPDLETYVEITSDRIPFEQRPEMKAYEITEKTVELLNSGHFDFGRINYPNGDMVGHSGVLDAAIKSVEVTDECVDKIVKTVLALDGVCVILADHGNADEMFTIDKNGVKTPKTSHTLNPVPCYIIDAHHQRSMKLATLDTPGLANIAATLCNLMGFEAPQDYSPSLIEPA